MDEVVGVRLELVDQGWRLSCLEEGLIAEANAFLGYLEDRNYSPRTIRTYGYGLVAFCRWMSTAGCGSTR